MKLKKIAGVLAAIGIAAPGVAMATNGMLMEGYGPIATGMGGASMAYDNGAAGMANNPATIGMMANGSNRLDLAIGGLHPDIDTKAGGMTAHSGGDAYYMPAVGWVKKDGALAYGVGVFAQGGMGTEYGTNTLVNQGFTDSNGNLLENRSEVGVGNLIVPLSYDVSPDLTIAGSLDFVWAGMDLKMMMDGTQMMDMMPGAANTGGTMTGTMVDGMVSMMYNPSGPLVQPGAITALNYGYFDFSNSNDFSGKAHSTGWAGKLGFTYKVNKQLTVGGTYHSKTSLGDMEGSASVAFSVDMDQMGTNIIPVSGKISVRDFQFPETYGLGLAYQANDKLMVAADYKRIGWKDVMKNFKMTFTASGNTSGMAAMFEGSVLNATMYQNWEDQDVFQIGVAYKATDALTLRAGANLANNPVPDAYVNPLFPATIKNHYTLGAGYTFSKVSEVNGSYTYAPKVTVNSPAGFTNEHAQANWQLMYSHRF